MEPVVLTTLEGYACVAGVQGVAQRVARLWGAAPTIQETNDISRDAYWLTEGDSRVSAVRSNLGEQTWEEAWRKGRVMTLDEAVSYALREETGG